MLMDLRADVLTGVTYLAGNESILRQMPHAPAKVPFDDMVLGFLNDLSQHLMHSGAAKAYSDVVTFAFWIRRASLLKLKERFDKNDGMIRMGRGLVFHIAPSNVPVNFAYSMVSGLLCGNANIVRVPTKDFEQVFIISSAIRETLLRHPDMEPYLLLTRYGHDRVVNDLFSSMADVRVIWGGDQTIEEIRKSPMPPRSREITFADRYSLAVIDSDAYLAIEDKGKVAEGFYNDTFLSDQNACTSPRLVVWVGEKKEAAKTIFWEQAHDLVRQKYPFQNIQGINKLVKACIVSIQKQGLRILPHEDNLIVRAAVSDLDGLIDLRENSGFFYEYDCDDLMDLLNLCTDKRIQTIGYIGESDMFLPLLSMGVQGIDRIVPIGKTMDFDLIWDGYELPMLLTRTVTLM